MDMNLEPEIKRLTKVVGDLQSQYDQAQGVADAALQELATRYDLSSEEVARAKLAELEAQIAATEKELERQVDALRKAVAEASAAGGANA